MRSVFGHHKSFDNNYCGAVQTEEFHHFHMAFVQCHIDILSFAWICPSIQEQKNNSRLSYACCRMHPFAEAWHRHMLRTDCCGVLWRNSGKNSLFSPSTVSLINWHNLNRFISNCTQWPVRRLCFMVTEDCVGCPTSKVKTGSVGSPISMCLSSSGTLDRLSPSTSDQDTSTEATESEGEKVIETTEWFFAIATPKSRERGKANKKMTFRCMAKFMFTLNETWVTLHMAPKEKDMGGNVNNCQLIFNGPLSFVARRGMLI